MRVAAVSATVKKELSPGVSKERNAAILPACLPRPYSSSYALRSLPPRWRACASCSCAPRIRAISAPRRGRCSRWALARLVLVCPHVSRSRGRGAGDGRDRGARARRSSGRWPRRSRVARLAIGLSARPRAFAGRVMPVREAAREAVARLATAMLRWCSAPRCPVFPTTELAQCGVAATIPANPDYPSLNVAAAVQVAAYELRWRPASTTCGPRRASRASHDEVEALYGHARRRSPRCASSIPRIQAPMPRLRRLFGRAGLEREEVNILRGILARIDQFVERDRER